MWESRPVWESLSSVVVVEEPLASSDELLLLDLELAAAVLSRSRCAPPISKRSLLRAWLPGVFALLGCFLWPVPLPSVGTLPLAETLSVWPVRVGPPLPLVWWSPVLLGALLPLPLARALPVLVAGGFPLPLAEALPLTLSLSLPESLSEESPGALPHSSDRLVRWAAAPTLSFLVPYTVS